MDESDLKLNSATAEAEAMMAGTTWTINSRTTCSRL